MGYKIQIAIAVQVREVNVSRVVAIEPGIFESEVTLIVATEERKRIVGQIGNNDVNRSVTVEVGNTHLRVEARETIRVRRSNGYDSRLERTVAVAQKHSDF